MGARFIVALSAALFVSSEAAAFYCSEPSEPSIPSGHYAEDYQMESAKDDVEDYIDEMNDYIACLNRAIQDAKSQADDVIDEWNDAVRAFNSL